MKKDRNPAVKMGNVTDLSNGTLDIEEQKEKNETERRATPIRANPGILG